LATGGVCPLCKSLAEDQLNVLDAALIFHKRQLFATSGKGSTADLNPDYQVEPSPLLPISQMTSWVK